MTHVSHFTDPNSIYPWQTEPTESKDKLDFRHHNYKEMRKVFVLYPEHFNVCVWSAWSDQKQIYRGFFLLNELCCHYELSESDGQKTNNQSKHRSTFPKHSQRSDMADLWDVDVWNVYTPLQWQEVSLCHLTYFVCVFYAFFGSFLTSIS